MSVSASGVAVMICWRAKAAGLSSAPGGRLEPCHQRRPGQAKGLEQGVGVASAPARMTGLEQLLSQADVALYRAKAMGRNRVVGA